MKKRLPYILLFLFASALVWFGMMFRQAISHALDAENRGHTYRNFFVVLDLYSQQTGEFLSSLEDMLAIDTEFGHAGVRWPHDAQSIAALIQPNFEIVPASNNLNAFAPDYEVKADWAAEHCESYCSQIIDRLKSNQ